jgi:ubiquinone/menaquinone biosynthesis C-methylase UbiE
MIKSALAIYQEKIFPFFNDLVTRKFHDERKRVLLQARGQVLEIGFGSGLSLACYPGQGVEKLTALEPSLGMRNRIPLHQTATPFAVEIVKGSAEALPFSDKSFDPNHRQKDQSDFARANRPRLSKRDRSGSPG